MGFSGSLSEKLFVTHSEGFVEEVPLLSIVICTYNRASLLEQTLASINLQDAVHDGRWAVVVVDNNCTDNTQEIISNYSDCIPGIRVVAEKRQGLTEARQRGFRATASPWVAFVDDDCILDIDWVNNVLDVCVSRSGIAAFNGLNRLKGQNGTKIPDWVSPKMFAASDNVNDREREEKSILHGAGLVLRREAVERSGWLDKPVAEDRRGKSLVSGGDNELAARARAGGGMLWYAPQCGMSHIIGPDRLEFRYLVRLNFCLAETGPAMMLIQSEKEYAAWLKDCARILVSYWLRPFGLRDDSLITENGGIRARILSLVRAVGFTAGFLKVVFHDQQRKMHMHGLATRARVEAMHKSAT